MNPAETEAVLTQFLPCMGGLATAILGGIFLGKKTVQLMNEGNRGNSPAKLALGLAVLALPGITCTIAGLANPNFSYAPIALLIIGTFAWGLQQISKFGHKAVNKQ